ncbi:muconate/chloromuconate family cycloisomerase [Proteiniborus sp. MB09-C3]|uniref:muconate/chloromuconate family cycloisomerase n=1 Tax=Proteiniborus sp. MB09-C3 TaxID=3050072 RepID=UPI0025526747|nr:muconate/chloromuconate family cycloisomerase [Proteiniborus sp. MB09-C3]WIV12287.1 muconate/chloromuconate family cycloisomerase [Proteiniborus sp. MB09-C3]
MAIKEFKTYILDMETVRPHQLSMTTITSQAIIVGRAIDEDGTEGWSEVANIGGISYGEQTPEAIKINIDTYLAKFVIGREAKDFNLIMHEIGHAAKGNNYSKAVVEGALIDLAARQKGIPAYELLGGKIHNSIPLAWTLASGNTERDIKEAKELLAIKRHKIFKLKIGTGDPDANVEHVRKIIEAVGDQAKVTVDINQAWDEDTSVRCIKKLQDYGVNMVEQPVPVWNYEAMARLTQKFDVPIMADESSTYIHDCFLIAKHRAGNCIALKPCKHGGLLETKKVAAIAEAAGFGLYGGTMIESSLGSAMALSVYSTISAFEFGTELFGQFLYKDRITVDELQVKDYELIIPDKPGFGLEVDVDKVKFYARDFY